jgi:hypothetical protein
VHIRYCRHTGSGGVPPYSLSSTRVTPLAPWWAMPHFGGDCDSFAGVFKGL